MMAQIPEYPQRPTQTDGLVQRLTSSDPQPHPDKRYLEALSSTMIKVFKDDPKASYVSEAAALSSVITGQNYETLVMALANTIINGTADGNIVDPVLLMDFAYVIRRAEGIRWAKTALGPVVASLQKRLKSAVEEVGTETQYRLICTLSVVLDGMIDIKTRGLSRETIHEPLLTQLKGLSTHQELRLAQAAHYAYQALLHIPDDEGPYQALWRHMSEVGKGAANVASAVSGMDPARLFDAIPGLMEMPTLVKSIIDLINGLGVVADGMKFLPKQKDWYFALRYTDMLIQAGAFSKLEEFILHVPCREEKEFLCGLYAELEQAWETGSSFLKGQVVGLLERVLVPVGSKYQRVQEWGKLVADTLQRSNWKEFLQHAPHSWTLRSLIPRKQKNYASTLKIFCGRKIRPETLPTHLLERAWLNCEEAQMFYADARIREYYTQGERLYVERLSGHRLPMDQCYIDLAVVEHSKGKAEHLSDGQAENQSSPLSLFARLKVETPNEDMQVSLPVLFEQRKRTDGTTFSPRRILIRGRAGVGKTTMCKKIVYNFIHHDMWVELFDRLLWVPLRALKERSESPYNFENLLRDQYFSQYDKKEHKLLARALGQAIRDPTSGSRTLFILDGLDEVSGQWKPENAMAKFLSELLNQPNVIITSRPFGVTPNKLDLELETIGFDPNQVKAYVNMTTQDPNNPTKAEDILAFIRGQTLIQGLVRIPILLDAVCYSWDGGFYRGSVPKTMTTLYQAIERKLWKKDVVRLEKSDGRQLLTKDAVQELLDSEIMSIMQGEINLLQGLAFTGLYNDIVEFDVERRGEIFKHLESMGPPSSNSLAKLSFLRTSDTLLVDKGRSHHFLHLTFQEFFAAQYFVRHWISGEPLSCLTLGRENPVDIAPETFLRGEKYNARYDILWRFVAGLLQTDLHQQHCFFQMLEKEPRDLLGPAHQRLLMHCFSEVSDKNSSLDHLRAEMENQLSQWLLFECKFRRHTRLGCDMECPEHLLKTLLLREESEATKRIVLGALATRPRISPDTMLLVASWLGNDVFGDLQIAAFEMLSHHHESSPKDIHQALALLLQDQDSHVRLRVAEALGSRSDLPKETLQALALLLQDQDQDMRSLAARALGDQSNLPKEILQALALLLQDQNSGVRSRTAQALCSQSDLPEEILQAVASLLQAQDSHVRSRAAEALGNRPDLPKDILQALALLLQDQVPDVRSLAASTLGGQSDLPKEILQALTLLLEDQVSHVRWGAAEALGSRSDLPKDILQALALLLQDQVPYVRSLAARSLRNQSDLPEEILQTLVSLLQDQDSNVRLRVAEALGNRSDLPKDIHQALALLLQDQDSHVRLRVAEALGSRSDLPKETIQALALLLQDQDEEDVRSFAARALGNQSNLPEEILQALVSLLQDQGYRVSRSAAWALCKRSDLPQEILQALAFLLIQDKKVSDSAEKVLRHFKSFSFFLPKLGLPCLKSLYIIWLRRSFDEQVSCYLWGETLFINMPEGLQAVPFKGLHAKFESAIHEAQADLGIPSRQTSSAERRSLSRYPISRV